MKTMLIICEGKKKAKHIDDITIPEIYKHLQKDENITALWVFGTPEEDGKGYYKREEFLKKYAVGADIAEGK